MPARIRVLEATWSSKSSNEVDESVRSLKPTRAANELLLKIFAFEMIWEEAASSRDTAQDTSPDGREGESLEAILAEPGMPTEAMFNQWLVEHEDVGDHLYRKCKTLDISRSEAIVCTDESKPKYKAPDWPKFYPLLGPPPVLSTESAQSYNNLITGFPQTLQPRDMMELIYVKEVTDATWEQARYTRQKTQVPERRYQQRLAAQATCHGILAQKAAGSGQGNGEASAVESILTEPLTELDPRQSFEAGFPYYHSLDAALMPAIKRRDNVLRQLDHWRDGLGLKACRLSNLFIAAARNGAAGQRA